MKTYHLTTNYKQILADTIKPVSVYLKLRDKFPNRVLLESSDYHANNNSFSYIYCNPIASIKVENKIITKQSAEDSKENSEHIMLEDLARNDLSRNGNIVTVEKYREVQYFSHVIHLVSKVTSHLFPKSNSMQVVADTFPARTLSGAPKHRAMQLINEIEKTNRGFYGGAIGFMDFEGNFNHAIMIRTFLSKNYTLHYQAGAGIVESSTEENELKEIYNKLGALDKALEIAENIN